MATDNDIIVNLIVKGTEEFKADFNSAEKSVEDLNKEIVKTGTESKKAADTSSKSFESFRTELKGLTSALISANLELAEMEDSGKRGTKEFTNLEKKIDDLRKKAGNLKDAMQDANEQIKATGSDTAGIDKTIRAVSSATAAFQIFEGVSALAGKSNEDLQKALVKLNAVMAITQGLQQIQNELVRKDSVFKGLATSATTLYALAVGKSTGAMKLFRIALASTGVGLIIVALGSLVANFDKVKAKVLETFPGLAKLSEYFITFKATALAAFSAVFPALKTLGVTLYTLFVTRNIKLAIQTAEAGIKEIKKVFQDRFAEVKLAALLKPATDEAPKVGEKIGQKIVQGIVDGINKGGEKGKTPAQSIQEQMQESLRAQNKGFELLAAGAARGAKEVQRQILEAQRTGGGAEPIRERASGFGQSEQEFEAEKERRIATTQSYFQEISAINAEVSNIIKNANEIRANSEIKALEERLQRGRISQKQFDKEFNKIRNEQAQKEKRAAVINAFLAIPQAFLAGLTKGGPILAAVYAALATVQASIVAASPTPKFKTGGSVAKRLGLIKGHSHEQGGVPIEVEGNEFVMQQAAVRKYGVDFMDSINNLKLNPAVTMSNKIEAIKQTDYKLYEHLTTLGSYMKQDYRTNERAVNLLSEINYGIRSNRKTYV